MSSNLHIIPSDIETSGCNSKPSNVSTDYEKAAINALHAVFTDTSVQGCFCTVYPSVYTAEFRHKDCIGLSLQIRLISPMAFMPVADIPAIFEALQDDS